jgi:hypothetical protein
MVAGEGVNGEGSRPVMDAVDDAVVGGCADEGRRGSTGFVEAEAEGFALRAERRVGSVPVRTCLSSSSGKSDLKSSLSSSSSDSLSPISSALLIFFIFAVLFLVGAVAVFEAAVGLALVVPLSLHVFRCIGMC